MIVTRSPGLKKSIPRARSSRCPGWVMFFCSCGVLAVLFCSSRLFRLPAWLMLLRIWAIIAFASKSDVASRLLCLVVSLSLTFSSVSVGFSSDCISVITRSSSMRRSLSWSMRSCILGISCKGLRSSRIDSVIPFLFSQCWKYPLALLS